MGNLGVSEKAEIIPLFNSFGPAATDKCIEALVVSEETKKTANKINQQRQRNGLNALTIITINMVPSEDYSPISTTRIRRGEIDREGRLTPKQKKLTIK